VIEYFKASPVAVGPGDVSTLSWSVVGATAVFIDGIGGVELRGMRGVSPPETTVYRLTAVNGTRNRTVEVRIHVDAGH
jgi:hypothetical protein